MFDRNQRISQIHLLVSLSKIPVTNLKRGIVLKWVDLFCFWQIRFSTRYIAPLFALQCVFWCENSIFNCKIDMRPSSVVPFARQVRIRAKRWILCQTNFTLKQATNVRQQLCGLASANGHPALNCSKFAKIGIVPVMKLEEFIGSYNDFRMLSWNKQPTIPRLVRLRVCPGWSSPVTLT